MSANRGLIVGASLVVAMMMPTRAAAQLSSRDVSIGDLSIAAGQRVSVTTADGRKIEGRVLSLSPTTVDIGKDRSVITSLVFSDVQRVQVRDSVANGVWIGTLTLGLVGAAWGAAGDVTSEFVTGVFTGKQGESNYTLTGTLVGASVGALLGYAIDAARVKTIYQRETGGMSVAVRPIASAAGKGVAVSVRW